MFNPEGEKRINEQIKRWEQSIKDTPRSTCMVCGRFRIQLFKVKKGRYVCKEHKHLIRGAFDD